MWTEWARLLALACFARACYEAARPRGNPGPKEPEGKAPGLLTKPEGGASLKSGPDLPLPPQAREWGRKAARRYREAQERQWRRWTEAMFEPKS